MADNYAQVRLTPLPYKKGRQGVEIGSVTGEIPPNVTWQNAAEYGAGLMAPLLKLNPQPYSGGGGVSTAGTPASRGETEAPEQQIETQARAETFKATQQYQADIRNKGINEASTLYQKQLSDIQSKYIQERLRQGIISGYAQPTRTPTYEGSPYYRGGEQVIRREDLPPQEQEGVYYIPSVEELRGEPLPYFPSKPTGKEPFWQIKTPQERLAETKFFKKVAPYLTSYAEKVRQPIFPLAGGGEVFPEEYPQTTYTIVPTIPKRETIGAPEFAIYPYEEPSKKGFVEFAMLDIPEAIGGAAGATAEAIEREYNKRRREAGLPEITPLTLKIPSAKLIPPSGMTMGGKTAEIPEWTTPSISNKQLAKFFGGVAPYALIPEPVLLGGGLYLAAKGSTTKSKIAGATLAGFGALGTYAKAVAPKIRYRQGKIPEPTVIEIQYPIKAGKAETTGGFYGITQKFPPVEARVSNIARDVFGMKPLMDWTVIKQPKPIKIISPFGVVEREPHISLTKRVGAKTGTLAEVSGDFMLPITPETILTDFDRWLLGRGLERKRGYPSPSEYLTKTFKPSETISIGNIYSEKLFKVSFPKKKTMSLKWIVPEKVSTEYPFKFLKPLNYAKYLEAQGKISFNLVPKRFRGGSKEEIGRIGLFKDIKGKLIKTNVPSIEILSGLPKTEMERTIAHELIHYKTPRWLFSYKVPYEIRPQELIAYNLEKYYVKRGFKIPTPSEPAIPVGRLSGTRAVSILEKIPVKEELPYNIYKSQLTFAPFEKSPTASSMTGKLWAFKPTVKEEGASVLSFIGGKKSSAKYLQELYQQPKTLITEIPKFPKPKIIKLKLPETFDISPKIVGGLGVVQSKWYGVRVAPPSGAYDVDVFGVSPISRSIISPAKSYNLFAPQIQKPIQRLDLGLSLGLETKQIQKIKPVQVFKEEQIIKQAQRLIITPAITPALKQKQIQKQIQKQKQTQTPFTFQIPRQRLPTPPKTPQIPIFNLPWFGRARGRRITGRVPTGTGFIPELRRRGKFIPISKPTSFGKAFGIGKQAARRTLGASIRIKGAKGYVGLMPSEEFIFGKSKEPTILMQAKTKRLKTQSEFQEMVWARGR